jgi:hypothetical protein
MNEQEAKIKVYCNEPYCEEFKIEIWKGGFMPNWFCEKHEKKENKS